LHHRPIRFAGQLHRVAPGLRALGVEVSYERVPGQGTRLIQLHRRA
jgi:hypothetical protein